LGSENKRIRKPINSLSTTQPKFIVSSWVGANAKKKKRDKNKILRENYRKKTKTILT
jgi:hypothetical protein